jgi:hypothetical protein
MSAQHIGMVWPDGWISGFVTLRIYKVSMSPSPLEHPASCIPHTSLSETVGLIQLVQSVSSGG